MSKLNTIVTLQGSVLEPILLKSKLHYFNNSDMPNQLRQILCTPIEDMKAQMTLSFSSSMYLKWRIEGLSYALHYKPTKIMIPLKVMDDKSNVFYVIQIDKRSKSKQVEVITDVFDNLFNTLLSKVRENQS